MSFNPRIAIAFVVGLVMVGGSYLLSQGKNTLEGSQMIVESEPSTRSFIKVADKNDDGLPDWQDSLKTPTINLDEGGEETEMSKTAAFAIELVTRTSSPNSNPVGLMTDLSTLAIESAIDEQYDTDDIVITSDNGPFSLRAYGNTVAGIVLVNAPESATEAELAILNRALLRNDEEVLADLDPIIVSYENMITDMLKTPVPDSLIREHLSLINVYQAILNDIKAFQNVFNDALPAMTRFRRYQADTEALYLAISNLYLALDEKGIKWTEADTASRFIKIE